MKSKLIKVLGLSAALNTAAAVLPTSISTVSAYAATREGYITNIEMENNKGNTVSLYTRSSCKSDYRLSKLGDNEKIPTELYGEVKDNISKVNISSLKLGKSNYTYKITKGGTEYNLDEDIRVSEGTNTIKVAIYDGSTLKETYYIKIDKDDDDDDDDDMGNDVYLDDVTLSNNYNNIKLGFDSKKYNYDLQVDNDITYVKIAAEPEDNDDRVKVNGVKVKDEDDWETKVSLAEGENKINIEVRDEDDENIRNYTINIKRLKLGQSSETTSSTQSTATVATNTTSTLVQANQNTNEGVQTASQYGQCGWQLTNDGRWHLYDVNGQLCKNSWYVDSKTNKSFYLDGVGNTASGWTTVNGKTYYFDYLSGEKKTGWINIDGSWYHLDNSGVLIS